MKITLTTCKRCQKITGCELMLADGQTIIPHLCGQDCLEPPEECEVRYMTFKKRVSNLCSKCDWEADKNED